MSKRSRRLPYPSDLSEKEWKIIKPHIPNFRTNLGRKRVHSYREILNAIFYLLRSGCAWRMLPHEFPLWKTVYHYFRLWRLKGIWEYINTVLRTELRIANGREQEPSAAILYSQSVKTTEIPGIRGYDNGKKVKGESATKRAVQYHSYDKNFGHHSCTILPSLELSLYLAETS